MSRDEIRDLLEIPNVGEAIAKKLALLGIAEPGDLIGKDPYQMYSKLCDLKRKRIDPCVIDVFISAVRYMEGGPARKWWEYTEERKAKLGDR